MVSGTTCIDVSPGNAVFKCREICSGLQRRFINSWICSRSIQQGPGFVHGSGDGCPVDWEELAEDCLCSEFALVDDGGEHAAGWGEFVFGAGAHGSAAFAAASDFTGSVTLVGLGFG
jgi:hypothetical protein